MDFDGSGNGVEGFKARATNVILHEPLSEPSQPGFLCPEHGGSTQTPTQILFFSRKAPLCASFFHQEHHPWEEIPHQVTQLAPRPS